MSGIGGALEGAASAIGGATVKTTAESAAMASAKAATEGAAQAASTAATSALETGIQTGAEASQAMATNVEAQASILGNAMAESAQSVMSQGPEAALKNIAETNIITNSPVGSMPEVTAASAQVVEKLPDSPPSLEGNVSSPIVQGENATTPFTEAASTNTSSAAEDIGTGKTPSTENLGQAPASTSDSEASLPDTSKAENANDTTSANSTDSEDASPVKNKDDIDITNGTQSDEKAMKDQDSKKGEKGEESEEERRRREREEELERRLKAQEEEMKKMREENEQQTQLIKEQTEAIKILTQWVVGKEQDEEKRKNLINSIKALGLLAPLILAMEAGKTIIPPLEGQR